MMPPLPHWRHRLGVAVGLLLVPLLLHGQGGPPVIDFSRPDPAIDLRIQGIPPDDLAEALRRFNGATQRVDGTFTSSAGLDGSLAVHRGPAVVGGVIRGDLTVINGDLRLTATARVLGQVIVLGGRLLVDPGAEVGDTLVWRTHAPVERAPDGTLQTRSNGRSLGDFTTTSFTTGPLSISGRLTAGPYNRVEELPIRIQPSLRWSLDTLRAVQLDLEGIARTTAAADGPPRSFGWSGSLMITTAWPWVFTGGVEAGDVVRAVEDQPFMPADPGLGALVLRRDYRDWYATRYWGLRGNWPIAPSLSLTGGVRFSRDASVSASDAFSLLRARDMWRVNPLIDDGRFVTATVGATWDTRDDPHTPTSGWYARGELRRVMSSAVTPTALPTVVRDPIDGTSYASNILDVDLRYYRRLNPTRSLHLRLAGGGWLGGDPMLMQHRRALGGTTPLGGFGFRALNCDPRRRPDPSLPALCDRQIVTQVELRQSMRFDLATHVGKRVIGFQQPDLVFQFDAGSAWLAGDGEWRVPAGRIRTLREWDSSIGVGLDGGLFGVNLSKALTHGGPFRLSVTFGRRF